MRNRIYVSGMIAGFVMVFVLALAGNLAQAAEEGNLLLKSGSTPLKVGKEANSVVYLHQLVDATEPSDSYLGFALGRQSYSRLELSNAYSTFNYASARPTVLSASFEKLPFALFGRFGFYGNLAFSTHEANLATVGPGGATRARVSVLPASAGLLYVADWHPLLKFSRPFFSIGPSYNLVLQGGDGDLLQARGSAWTLRRAVGLRHSLSWLGLTASELSAEYTAASMLDGKGAILSSSSFLFGYLARL